MEITRSLDGSKGLYVLEQDGYRGELTFTVLTPEKIIADHTRVDEALRGSGAANALVERLVTDARAEGVSIVPLCPFVNRWRARHPEASDVFAV